MTQRTTFSYLLSRFQEMIESSESSKCVQWTWLEKIIFCNQNFSNLLWEKNVVVIEKNFWNSRL